ncbi:uncharacterized protein LOC115422452 [Sphaeramia orbicularis]|uniref:uncharacterized protein LOC115422452 n=1 Tax=Sphaeramia orbicularis TaxID=375764 RepID=UPI00117F0344|nr:transcription factor-like 5 protein [Sphaeramia orbicularis]
MSAFSTSCKTVHMSPSPSSTEHTCESVGLILSQGGFLTHDQGQVLGTELGLMEMTEVEYTHLQHFIQADMDMQAAASDGPDGRSYSDTVITKDAPGSAVVSLFSTAEAIDLSTSTDEHNLVMPGERTPSSSGKVPSFVLAKIRDDDSQNEPPANINMSSPKRTCSAARVCLEKRFNSICADTPKQQDVQAAVLSNCLAILQQSAGAQDTDKHPQKQKWMKTDRTNAFETSSPYVGGFYNPVTNMFGQVIGHIPQMGDPKMHQSLIINSFPLNICPETVLAKAHCAPSSNIMDKQQSAKREGTTLVLGSYSLIFFVDEIPTLAASRKHGSAQSAKAISAAKVAPDLAGESGKKARKRVQRNVSHRERRERHNSKERERRRRIRLFCDELNTLVPFCYLDTDKATTLQWTTAYLKYINKMHGDTIKEEFEKLYRDKKDLKSSSSELEQIHQEMDETLSIPLAAEQ